MISDPRFFPSTASIENTTSPKPAPRLPNTAQEGDVFNLKEDDPQVPRDKDQLQFRTCDISAIDV